MLAHHLKLNPDKTELLFLPGKDSPIHDLSINTGTSVVSQTHTGRNLDVIFNDQLSFTANMAATPLLLNIRIRLLLTQKATQVLVQALDLSRLDY